jgi:hypothetical protein
VGGKLGAAPARPAPERWFAVAQPVVTVDRGRVPELAGAGEATRGEEPLGEREGEVEADDDPRSLTRARHELLDELVARASRFEPHERAGVRFRHPEMPPFADAAARPIDRDDGHGTITPRPNGITPSPR